MAHRADRPDQRIASDDPLRTADLPAFEGKLRGLISTSVPAVASARLSALFIHRAGVTAVAATGKRTVGRGGLANIRIREPSLSRLHAQIEEHEGKLWIEDLGSRHGITHREERIDRIALEPGEHVHIGSVVLAAVRNPRGAGTSHAWPRFIDHERFMLLLQDDVLRAKSYGRRVGLVMLRDAKGSSALLLEAERMVELLGPADRIAVYSSGVVEIVQPETDGPGFNALLRKLSNLSTPPLACGGALFPEGATTSEELLGAALGQLGRCSTQAPIQRAIAASPLITDSAPGDTPGPLAQRPVVAAPVMLELYEQAAQLAAVDLPVLITGETGSGKEMVAHALHQQSRRSKRTMRYINCAAIPESLLESTLFGHERGAFTGADKRNLGVFEAADGSTLLLDEVGELTLASQAALLRVLETGTFTRVGGTAPIKVDVRLVAATNQDLQQLVNAKRFRVDLLFRLNGMALKVPPLRERKEEIEPLVLHFVRHATGRMGRPMLGLEAAALTQLEQYEWPGNVRELRNVIERAVALARGSTITASNLPSHLLSFAETRRRPTGPQRSDPELIMQTEGLDFKQRLQRIETALILDALKLEGWNQTAAAKRLGIPFRTMTYKMKAYGIRRAGYELSPD